jgi:hypothetical protein
MARKDKPIDPTETQIQIEAAIKQLVEEGILYDTGRRRWSERTGRYQIVWSHTGLGERSHMRDTAPEVTSRRGVSTKT